MFGLLKKATPQAVVTAAERVANMVKPDHVIVQQIHDDFDTASQSAVIEAKKILAALGNADTKSQVDALKAAGFNNVPMVTEWDKEALKRNQAETKIQIVEKYAQKYPGQKFIFIDQVKDICKKYDLLCVPVSKYKGSVPQKNILEISKFKALPEDSYLEESSRWSDRVEYDFTKRHNFKDKNQVAEMRKRADQRNSEMYRNRDYGMPFPSMQAMPTFSEVPLFICAPKGDILMNKDDKVSNEVFMTREVKDPIVLHYVGDGFLIVTKWGPEAQDKDIVNEKMN